MSAATRRGYTGRFDTAAVICRFRHFMVIQDVYPETGKSPHRVESSGNGISPARIVTNTDTWGIVLALDTKGNWSGKHNAPTA